jgi:hypothetical protein
MGTTEHTFVWTIQPKESFEVYLGHSRVGDTLLEDSGWHCSFCFRYIEDFVNKMEAYSHADRAKKEYKNPQEIQRRICTGEDLFGRVSSMTIISHDT